MTAVAARADAPAVQVRRAAITDVDALVQLRALLFDDGGSGTEDAGRAWQGACRQLLIDGFTVGDLLGVVAEAGDGTIVAGGIAALRRWLPSPTNPSGLTGYIDSLTTSEPWRRQGIGRRVIEALVEALVERGAIDVHLHAAPPGVDLLLPTPDREP